MKKILYFLGGLFLQATPYLVSAAVGNPASVTLKNPLSCNNLGICVCDLAYGLFIIGVPIAIMMVLVGAFQMMFAAGDENRVQTARKTIMYAVIGFLVLIVGRGIILVVYQLLGGTGKLGGSC